MSLTDIEIGHLLRNAARAATALEHIAQALGNPVPQKDPGPVKIPSGDFSGSLDKPEFDRLEHPTRVHTAPPVGT